MKLISESEPWTKLLKLIATVGLKVAVASKSNVKLWMSAGKSISAFKVLEIVTVEASGVLNILLKVTSWLLPAVIVLPSAGAVERIWTPPPTFWIVKEPKISLFESSTTCNVACDEEEISETKSVKAPETEPPATKPVPKPTASPTLKEDIAKEPPSETIILDDISDSSASWVIVKLISESEPWTKLLKLNSAEGLKSDWEWTLELENIKANKTKPKKRNFSPALNLENKEIINTCFG